MFVGQIRFYDTLPYLILFITLFFLGQSLLKSNLKATSGSIAINDKIAYLNSL